MIEFVYPQFFWVMIVPFAVFTFLVVTNKEKVARIFDEKAMNRLRADEGGMPSSMRNLLLLLSVFAMIVALSRPVVERGERTVRLRGITLMTALDISGSMRSKDIYPSRLEFAKKKMIQLIEHMPSDEIAVSAFAHSAFMLSPFTTDSAVLKQIISGVNESYINMASTDFDAIADQAVRMLKNKDKKILILFSDGGDEKSLENIAMRLKKEGITLYAVLIGTRRGAPVLNDKGEPIRDKEGNIVISRVNAGLGKAAEKTGGSYLFAGNGSEDMKSLADTVHSKFSAGNRGSIKIEDRKELFYYPLILSVLLLLAGLSSLPAGRGRVKTGDVSR